MKRPLVVTGPTGWIGCALLARLAADGDLERARLFGASARTVEAPDGTPLRMRALADIRGEDVADADIIHLAYLTKEKAAALGERAFAAGNAAIDGVLLRAMAEALPHAVFVASSGAAMLAERGLDLHPYGLAKLAQERAFLDFGRTSDVPVFVARIFNLAGPYVNKLDSYAIASFLTQAFRRGRIDVEASHPVYRSYLHVDDLARLALALLAGGIGLPAPIDFCGSETVEMADIARAAAAAAGLDAAVIDRPALSHAIDTAYLGDPVAMRTLALRLGVPLTGFHRQMQDTADFLRPPARARVKAG